MGKRTKKSNKVEREREGEGEGEGGRGRGRGRERENDRSSEIAMYIMSLCQATVNTHYELIEQSQMYMCVHYMVHVLIIITLVSFDSFY